MMKYLLVTVMIGSMLFPAFLERMGRETILHPSRAMDGKQIYRTARAMRNEETWAFAQHTWGVVCRRLGLALVIFTALFYLLLFRRAETGDAAPPSGWWLLPAGVELAALPTARLLVERALKKNFDKNGTRR